MEHDLFQFSDELLELDALEMDGVLRHVLRNIPNEGKLLIHFTERAREPRQVKGRKRDAVAVQPILCSVDHASNMLIGDGLGETFSHLAASSATPPYQLLAQFATKSPLVLKEVKHCGTVDANRNVPD